MVMAVVLRYNSGIGSGSIGGTGSSSGSDGETWLGGGYCHIWDIQYYCEGYGFSSNLVSTGIGYRNQRVWA